MLLFSNVTDVKPGFSLELSEDVRVMRDWVHEFAASVIRPAAAEWDEREQTPWPILQEAAKIGLSLVGSTLAAVSVVSNGTPEQIGEWCPQMFGDASDVKLGAFCSSEPGAGSDVAAIRTRAVYDEAAVGDPGLHPVQHPLPGRRVVHRPRPDRGHVAARVRF